MISRRLDEQALQTVVGREFLRVIGRIRQERRAGKVSQAFLKREHRNGRQSRRTQNGDQSDVPEPGVDLSDGIRTGRGGRTRAQAFVAG